MKKNFLILILVGFLNLGVNSKINKVFAITEITNNNKETVVFPFDIPFSEKEIASLKKYSKLELEKLARVAKMVADQKLSNSQNQTQILPGADNANNNNTPTIYSNSPSTQTPYYNPQTGQYQSKPVSNNTNIPINSNSQSPINSALPNSSPSQSYTPNAPDYYSSQAPFGGENVFPAQQYQALQIQNAELQKLFPETRPGGNCADFGARNQMGGRSVGGVAALSGKLKFDLANLCTLTGKRIILTSGRRATGVGYHTQGYAIDTAMNPYTEAEKVIVTLYFMSRYYGGIGSYGSQPMHFDHRNHSMRWGPPAPYRLQDCRAGNYYPSVQKAFQLINISPCSTPDIRLVAERAKAVLKSLGKENFIVNSTATGV